jgi:hypothetical protein
LIFRFLKDQSDGFLRNQSDGFLKNPSDAFLKDQSDRFLKNPSDGPQFLKIVGKRQFLKIGANPKIAHSHHTLPPNLTLHPSYPHNMILCE